MQIDSLRTYCLSKPGEITEGFPFGEGVLVFKVYGKMFSLIALDAVPISVNLKCPEEYALELRERYDAVRPGYHMHKRYWNTVILDGSLDDVLIQHLVDVSYDEVVRTLPRSVVHPQPIKKRSIRQKKRT